MGKADAPTTSEIAPLSPGGGRREERGLGTEENTTREQKFARPWICPPL